MKTFTGLLGLCALLAAANCNERVKRIVGGEKAAIPKPLDFSPGVKAALTAEASRPPKSAGSTRETPKSKVIDDVTVGIYEEEVVAKVQGRKEPDDTVTFKGIRYAEPPEDKNRFQRPILVHPKDEIKAYNYGSPCIQPLPDGSGTVGAEDCLFLNIHTPTVYVKNASGFPVFFWIHGGGFTSGSGNQYGASELVKKNIVVVTLNYRLGSLGFLGTRDQQMAGNAGLFDVRAAFEWTRRYIPYFGGDKRRIFVAGQGNGASLAMLLAQSDFTSGYLKGVFAMSGTGISSNAVDYKPSNTSNFIATANKCTDSSTLNTLRCLQKSGVDSLFQVDKSLQNDRIGDGGFVNAISKLLSAGPIVEGRNDGRFLPYFLNDNPLNALKAKKVAKVPLLIGTTKSETGKAITGKFKDDVLKKLRIPNFLNKVLPKSLVENNVGVFVGKLASDLMSFLCNNDKYLGLFSIVSKAASEIEKVVEATTDALFNLPASTTSQLWDTAGGESYFYSFEHQSGASPAKHFLEGLQWFAGAPTPKDNEVGSSHGDDLLYLFELQTLEGKKVSEAALTNSRDLKVKNLFVNIVAEFLYTGKPKIVGLKENWPPFKKDHSYAIISDKPRFEKKFRYCQVALWGGFIDKLEDSFCNLPGISDIKKLIPRNLLGGGILNPTDLPRVFEKVLPTQHLKLPGGLPLPGAGLLGGNRESGNGGLLGGGKEPSGSGLLPIGEKGNKVSGGLLPNSGGSSGGLLSGPGGLLGGGSNGGKPKPPPKKPPRGPLGGLDLFG